MKMTIGEVIDKLRDIETAIDAIHQQIKTEFLGQEPLSDAIDLLEEYAEVIRDTKVDI